MQCIKGAWYGYAPEDCVKLEKKDMLQILGRCTTLTSFFFFK